MDGWFAPILGGRGFSGSSNRPA